MSALEVAAHCFRMSVVISPGQFVAAKMKAIPLITLTYCTPYMHRFLFVFVIRFYIWGAGVNYTFLPALYYIPSSTSVKKKKKIISPVFS